MADTIRKVDYFSMAVSNRPGAALRMLDTLRDAGVNLLAFTGGALLEHRAQGLVRCEWQAISSHIASPLIKVNVSACQYDYPFQHWAERSQTAALR